MKYDKDSFTKIGLLPYQSAFAANNSRFKIGLWARQTGKDHTATAEAVLDCARNPGTTWIIVAASERQAIESLAKAKDWARIIKFQIDQYSEAPANVPYSLARTASTEIKWSNGSRLIALPANPSTIRGYSANLILTEFAFHENPEALWRAIYPTISNPLRGGTKKLRIISTPNGLNNKFAHLWHAAPTPIINSSFLIPNSPSSPSSSPLNLETSVELSARKSETRNHKLEIPTLFHKSRITIHHAIAAGLPLDPAELQAGLNDPEAWSQEYLCAFMDNSTVLLPYDLIETCESPLASELSSLHSLSVSAIPGNSARPQLFAGIDFARKNHLTVCWILERLPASAIPNLHASIPNSQSSASPNNQSSFINHQFIFLTREVLCLRNLSTPEQLEALRPRLKLCQRICLDYTGPGVGLGDYVNREFGASRVELCTFTSSLKAELFPRLAAAFESRQLLIPIGRDIREDLHSIYRTVTNSGNIIYRAHGGSSDSPSDGHADRTTALALSLRAAQSAPTYALAKNIGQGSPYLRDSRRGRNSFTPPERTIAIIY